MFRNQFNINNSSLLAILENTISAENIIPLLLKRQLDKIDKDIHEEEERRNVEKIQELKNNKNMMIDHAIDLKIGTMLLVANKAEEIIREYKATTINSSSLILELLNSIINSSNNPSNTLVLTNKKLVDAIIHVFSIIIDLNLWTEMLDQYQEAALHTLDCIDENKELYGDRANKIEIVRTQINDKMRELHDIKDKALELISANISKINNDKYLEALDHLIDQPNSKRELSIYLHAISSRLSQDEKNQAYFRAAKNGFVSYMAILAEHGANPSQNQKNQEFLRASQLGLVGNMKALVACGANPVCTSQFLQKNALHICVKNNSEDCVDYLSTLGDEIWMVLVNSVDRFNKTPSQYATKITTSLMPDNLSGKQSHDQMSP